MGIPKLILTAIALLLFYISHSQAICGFDQLHGRRMKSDPVYRKNILDYESNLRKSIQQLSAGKTNTPSVLSGTTTLGTALYTIPVVVHIVHTGGALGSIYNPTDAQVQATIAYLNQVYNGSYPGTVGAGDLQIQFVLAQRDPNCNPTNGINHVDGSSIAGYVSGGVNVNSSLGTDEINVKNLIRWDPTQYYNIWVVDKIDGNDGTSGTFIAGYAYFPGSPSTLDGTVLLATQMAAGMKTLPHELGHGFNLYHPFQNPADPTGASCPSNTNCNTDGDQVCDTDPITEPVGFICRTGTNPCTSTAYSINTESNYMNYTNCNTLFTAGQKTRMLASAGSPNRISLSTSLGGTPPDGGTTTCNPKIDFELDNYQVTEATAATTGCRSYTDYQFNMVIGNIPTATATATLGVVSGTATEGLDFDITTNGNFLSPSKVLTFPTGSDALQTFTIRVYDDASVEGTENFVLGFTVNNGGGNASAGDGRPNLTITIYDNDVAPYGPVSVTKSVGSSLGSMQSPFAASNTKQKSQSLYRASDLSSAGIPAGNITGLALNLVKASATSFVYNGLTIKLGLTTQNSLYNGSTQFPVNDVSFTTVYSSNYSTLNGWNNIGFSTAFTWDGTSNIVVEICYDNGGATDLDDDCLGYIDGSNNVSFAWGTINCGASFSSFNYYAGGVKPIIQFVYPDPGTQVQTILNSSKQEYLGPNSDIYFYDQANNKLMARIQNLSNFNYDCTQVIIDRAGTGATAFWNNTPSNYLMDKTFHVLPTNNNPSGSYNITLYYTQTEVNGWQTATGQNLANIQLVKTTNPISSVTPSNPTAGGTTAMGIPSITSVGTNTGLSYNFTTGFSGFGAGVMGTILATESLNFEGHLFNNHASLDWTTSSEENVSGFEIERSYDAVLFTELGFTAAVGNSASKKDYFFNDPDPALAISYYRLKQINSDNSFQYSKVILIRSTNDDFKVLNNPFVNTLDIQLDKIPTGPVFIRLSDVTGRELYRTTTNPSESERIEINLSGCNLSQGIYLLEVTYNNQRHVARILKQ
jgi:Pregnancy-associated plasma protein-A/Secretion system C-terminal sorting domain